MIREFQDYCRHNLGLAESTVSEYGKDLHYFVSWLQKTAGVQRWGMVKRSTVEAWVKMQHEQGTQAATIKRRISSVRRLYQWAWLQGLCKVNPAKFVSTPKMAVKLPNVMQLDDIKAAINDANIGLNTRAMIAVMAEAGLRISEAMRIKDEDFDSVNRTIRVTGKGNKERVVYYGDATARMMALGGFRWKCNEHDSERQRRYDVWHALYQHCRNERCNPHSLRHTFASKMVENGVGLSELAMIMGHASVQTTERYTHLCSDAVRESYRRCMPVLT